MKAKIRTDILRIKGTRHYCAKAALSSGELRKGSTLLLVPEPQNSHDKNAVAIFTNKRNMLGHISKDIAAKYQRLCFENQIHKVEVISASKSDDYAKFDIRVGITYTAPIDKNKFNLPSSAGSYEISLKLERTYIGATSNLKRRCDQHLNNLINGVHSNNVLQNDFNITDLEFFTFTVLRDTENLSEAEEFESNEIIRRLGRGESLYNKTIDGQGISGSKSGSLRTISDARLAPETFNEGGNKNEIKRTEFSNGDVYVGGLEDGKRTGQGRYEFVYGDVYVGAWKDNKKHGQGRLEFASGAVYDGTWKDGKQHGQGRYEFVDGDVYDGAWKDGKRTGQGRLEFADGAVYVGEYEDGKQHGQGRLEFADGDVYDGEYEDGKRTGQGRLEFADGDVYDGAWKDDNKHGQGRFECADGEVYVGEFKDDEVHGQGRYEFADGAVYVGTWKDGKRTGQGRYEFASGNVYVGEFKDGNKHSQGRFEYADGDVYDGAWKDDNKHGQGRFEYADGGVYVGEFKDGKMHGQGRVESKDGDVYIGGIKAGKMHGQGRYESKDGDVYVGEFKDNEKTGANHFHKEKEAKEKQIKALDAERVRRKWEAAEAVRLRKELEKDKEKEKEEAQRFRIEKEAPYDEIKYLLEQEGWIVKAAFFSSGYNITNPEGKKYKAETLSDLRELYRSIINPH